MIKTASVLPSKTYQYLLFSVFFIALGVIGNFYFIGTDLAWMLTGFVVITGTVLLIPVITTQRKIIKATMHRPRFFAEIAPLRSSILLVVGAAVLASVTSYIQFFPEESQFYYSMPSSSAVDIIVVIIQFISFIMLAIVASNSIYIANGDKPNKLPAGANKTSQDVGVFFLWVFMAFIAFLVYNFIYTLRNPNTE